MSNRFEELFGVFPDDKLHEAFENAQIKNVRIAMEKKSIEIDVFFPVLVTYRITEKAEEYLRESLSVSSVSISEVFSEEYFHTLAHEANLAIAATNGFFVGSSAGFDGRKLYVELTHGGGDILKSVNAAEFMQRIILKRFGRQVEVEFCGATELEFDNEQIAAFQKKAEEENLIAKGIDPATVSIAKPKEHKIVEGIPLYLETQKAIYGNIIRTSKLQKLCDISIESGNVAVWGEIFSLDVKTTRDGRNNIINFNITDKTYSYTVKIFETVANAKSFLGALKEGETVIVYGKVSYDKYSGENIISATSVNTVKPIKKQDNAEVKRVELHLHTNMSEMDGMTSADKLVKDANSKRCNQIR